MARGPKPGWKQARAAQEAAAPAPTLNLDELLRNPLKRGIVLHDLTEPDLRIYARGLGLRQADCDTLSVERLRQNCAARYYQLIEEATA